MLSAESLCYQARLLCGDIEAFYLSFIDPDYHSHWPTAHLTVDREFRAAFARLESEREGLSAMRTFDGQRFMHAATVIRTSGKATGQRSGGGYLIRVFARPLLILGHFISRSSIARTTAVATM
jgi:hypothetical protein